MVCELVSDYRVAGIVRLILLCCRDLIFTSMHTRLGKREEAILWRGWPMRSLVRMPGVNDFTCEMWRDFPQFISLIHYLQKNLYWDIVLGGVEFVQHFELLFIFVVISAPGRPSLALRDCHERKTIKSPALPTILRFSWQDKYQKILQRRRTEEPKEPKERQS